MCLGRWWRSWCPLVRPQEVIQDRNSLRLALSSILLVSIPLPNLSPPSQGSGFSRTDGLMGNTMRRLNKMLQTSSGRHMLWLVGFVVFVFVFVYYIVKHKG